MILGLIGPIQIFTAIVLCPLSIFLIGFFIGRKVGYSKKLKENKTIL